MAETVSEKVVRLETQMANVTSEVLEVKSLVKEVIIKVDNFTNIQNEVLMLKSEILELKKRTFRNSLIFPVAAAVSGSVLTVLILSYIGKLGR